MNQAGNNLNNRGLLKTGYGILTHICFKYHIGAKAKILIGSFIIVLPALVQYFLFDEPEYLISFILCFSLSLSVFLLTRASLVLTLPFAVISFIYTFFLVVYRKSLGATSIMALMNTQVDVMFNFTVSPMMITASLVFIMAFIMYVRFILLKGKNDQREELIPEGKSYIPITVTIVATCFFIFGYAYVIKAYPFSLSRDSTTYVKIVSAMKKKAEETYKFEGTLCKGYKESKNTFVLIVGESSRRASWSLYGYERKTNLFLSHEIDEHPGNFILFKDYIATAQTTYPSLMNIFSPVPSRDFIHIPQCPSFVGILKNLDYETYFVSTYGNIFMNFINAKQHIIIKSADDNELVPVLKKILDDKSNSKKLIVLHLRGSHCGMSEYKYTYSGYISPSANPVLDKYDNTILQTDMFLKNVAELVMGEKDPVCVWYMPDHGENLNDSNDKNFTHGCSGFTRYEIELPSVMFYNKSFMDGNPGIKAVNANKNTLVSHSNVAHTVMGLCGAFPKEYLSRYDVSSENFRRDEPYLVDVDLFPIRYSRAEIKR